MRKIAWIVIVCMLMTWCAAAEEASDAVTEEQLRKDMTQEETDARVAELAEYRGITREWLCAVLIPEGMVVPVEDKPEEILLPDSTGEPEIVYTPEDAYKAFAENPLGQTYIEALDCDDWQEALQKTVDAFTIWHGSIDTEALKEINDDYEFWLWSPSTLIDYPVAHGEDNDFYLAHLLNGRHNSSGTLFVDCNNLPDFQDPNTIVYGHHMRNYSMFGSLNRYEKPGYYEAHPWMLVICPDRVILLEILAGYTTSSKDHAYNIAITDTESFIGFVDMAREKSDFVSDTEPVPGDSMLTMSTCAYAFENARYVVIGKQSITAVLPEEDVSTEDE